jgi:tetratricopeptide (TPR) repeat protein
MLVIQILDDRSDASPQDTDSRLAVQWQAAAPSQTTAPHCFAVRLDHNPELKANLREVLGQACIEYGSPEQAIAALHEAVGLKTRVFGDSHPSVAATQRCLASALRHASRFDDAGKQIDAAIATMQQYAQTDTVEYADILLEKAAIDLAAHRLDAAHQGAAVSFAKFESRKDIRKLHSLDLTARVIDVCAGNDNIKRLEAAKIYSQILKEPLLGNDHPWRNTFVQNEGTILHGLGEYKAAKRKFDAVIDRWEQEAGSARPCVIDAYINRGRAHRALGDGVSAKRDIVAALKLDREIRGASHPYVAYDLVCLARVLMEDGGADNTAQAGRALDEAVEIYRQAGFEHHAYLEVALRRRYALLKNPRDREQADAIRSTLDASCARREQQCS